MEGVNVENQYICRACLKIVEFATQSFGYIDDATGNLRDMLMCCVPEMDIYVSSNPIICIQCIQLLINVQNFKSRCINTESIIRTYLKKYNVSDENPINLGAVVRDLIEINNFYKQQEERRRQLAMQQYAMQQRNNLGHPRFPSPPYDQTHIPVPVRDFPRASPPMGHTLPVRYVHHNLGPPPQIRQTPMGYVPSHMGHMVPMQPAGPMISVQPPSTVDSAQSSVAMGFRQSVDSNGPLQANSPLGSGQHIGSVTHNTYVHSTNLTDSAYPVELMNRLKANNPTDSGTAAPTVPVDCVRTIASSNHLDSFNSSQQRNYSLNSPPPLDPISSFSYSSPITSAARSPMSPTQPWSSTPCMRSMGSFGLPTFHRGNFHHLGPPPPLTPVGSLQSPSFGFVLPLDKVEPRFSNGYTIPSQAKQVPIQQNFEHSSPDEPLVTSSSDTHIEEVDEGDGNVNNNSDSITSSGQISKSSDDSDSQSAVTSNKTKYHPIESKLRLVISIPRHNITIPFKRRKLSTDDDPDVASLQENSNETEDVPMEEDTYPLLADIPDDIREDLPEYLPEDGNFNIVQETVEQISLTSEPIESKSIRKIFNCYCMYLTTSEALYEEHKKKCKTGKKNMIRCPHCPHITNRTYALNKHINTMHTKAIWYLCDFCTYRSTDKSCLRRHVRKNHEEKNEPDPNKHFFCHMCSLIISTEHNYNRHMLRHDESNILVTYDCEFCSYHTKDRSNYRKHIFTHCPIQLQCPNCPYSNVSPYSLKSHIKKFHDGAGIEVADCKSEVSVNEIVRDIRELLNSKEGDVGTECS